MSRFRSLLIDPAYLDFIDADSAELSLRVRVDAVQSLTLAQQLQARQNINAEQAGVAAQGGITV